MDVRVIPFEGRFLISRPLARLAFVGNAALARRARAPAAGSPPAAEGADAFLGRIGFLDPDPPAPPPWRPSADTRRTSAVLLLTSACNLRCTYCYARGGEDGRLSMPMSLALAVVRAVQRNARELGRTSTALAFHGGGEPTLAWDVLCAAVEESRSGGLACQVTMSTNGVMTDAKRRYVARHFQGLSLSFDGLREVQDAQRPRAGGTSSFGAVMETAAALEEGGVPYGVRMTVTPATWERLREGVEFICERTRAVSIQVEPSFGAERGVYCDPQPREARGFIGAFLSAFDAASRRGRFLVYSGARPWAVSSAFCRAPEEAVVVTPEGDVVACFETHDRRHPLTEQFRLGRATAEGVWLQPERIAAFAAAQEGRRRGCRSCFCYWHCGGDCASRCALSARRDRVRCSVNRALTRELIAWYVAAGGGVWRGCAPTSSQPLAAPA